MSRKIKEDSDPVKNMDPEAQRNEKKLSLLGKARLSYIFRARQGTVLSDNYQSEGRKQENSSIEQRTEGAAQANSDELKCIESEWKLQRNGKEVRNRVQTVDELEKKDG